jgi:plastocyanin
MALWGLTDALVDAPKWLTPKFTFDGTDVTGGVFTIANHGIKNGDQITFANGTGTLAGIAPGTLWHAKVLSANTFELYSNADLSTGKVTPSNSAGTGHTVQVTPSDVYFADVDEVQVQNNIERGFHVPGWYRYSAGTGARSGRHDVELLCAFSAGGSAEADTGDTGIEVGSDDDSVLED